MKFESTYGLRLLAKPRVRFGVFAVLLSVVLVVRVAQFVVWTGQRVWGYDFSAYWLAARHLLDHVSPYSAAQLAGPYSGQGDFLYLNAPIVAAAATPFALLFPADFRLANWIWAGIGALILVWAVLSLVRVERIEECFPAFRGRRRWWLVAVAFAFPPVVDELVVGNVNLILLGLLAAAWLGVRQGGSRGDLLAGVGVGAATLVKVFPGFLILWFLLTRRWRAAAWSVVAIVGLAAISLPITGIQPWLDYPRVLLNLSLTPNAIDALAPTFWLAPYLGFTWARIVVTAIGLLILLWVVRRAQVEEPPPGFSSALIGFAITVCLAVLVTPALYTSYLTVLVLPLLLGFAALVPRGPLLLAYLLMWGGRQDALGDYAWIVTRGLPTAGALLLLALLIRQAARPHGVIPLGVPLSAR